MDALQGRPKAETIRTIDELRKWTLDARLTLVRGYAEGHSQRNLAAMIWLTQQGNRVPLLWGATDFEPHRPADPYRPHVQDHIAIANTILAWCDRREPRYDGAAQPAPTTRNIRGVAGTKNADGQDADDLDRLSADLDRVENESDVLEQQIDEGDAGDILGVSPIDVALCFDDDIQAAKETAKNWRDRKLLTATIVGKCPLDGRVSLYKFTEIYDDAVKLLSLTGKEKALFRQQLRTKLRRPRT